LNERRSVAEMAEKKQRRPRQPTLLSVAKQAKKAGIAIARIEVEPTGKITIITGSGDAAEVTTNPWDAEIAKLKASRP
jgi:hypothetical protein